jgi:hypothetical protein
MCPDSNVQTVALSDESDFNRDDAPPEDEQRKRTGKKKKNEAKATKSVTSKNSIKDLGGASREQSSADEFEVENEDSQTFAVFKMRTANQEQARKKAERESRRISNQSYVDTARTGGKKHINNNSSQSSGSSRGSSREEIQHSIATISGMTQSVKLSKRTRLQFPVFGQDESLPYQVMQRKSAFLSEGEDEDNSEDDQELLRSVMGAKTEENEGNRMIPSFPTKCKL